MQTSTESNIYYKHRIDTEITSMHRVRDYANYINNKTLKSNYIIKWLAGGGGIY